MPIWAWAHGDDALDLLIWKNVENIVYVRNPARGASRSVDQADRIRCHYVRPYERNLMFLSGFAQVNAQYFTSAHIATAIFCIQLLVALQFVLCRCVKLPNIAWRLYPFE